MPPTPHLDNHTLRIAFLCRGSVTDGLGHLMRSKTVATYFLNHADLVFVVIGDQAANSLMSQSQLDYAIAGSDAEAYERISKHSPDGVVFDTMHFDATLFGEIASSAPTFSLCPIFDCLEGTTLLFHRTAVEDPRWRGRLAQAQKRCGLKYSVIGNYCQRISAVEYNRHLEQPKLAVAVSMGGADAPNKTLQVIEHLKELETSILLWVMLGEGYTHSYEALAEAVKGSRHEIILVKSNDSLWRILGSCSLAILAGGTTTYEAVHAGLPSINLLEDERHYFLIDELTRHRVCFCLPGSIPETGKALIDLVKQCQADRNRLLDMHLRSEGLIDPFGAQRIALEIEANLQTRVTTFLPRLDRVSGGTTENPN